MARYRTSSGMIVDTDLAVSTWDESRDWDGSNHIGRSSGSQWHHEVLHLSSKGNYYLERRSSVQGTRASADFVSKIDAARWLLHNEQTLPDELRLYIENRSLGDELALGAVIE